MGDIVKLADHNEEGHSWDVADMLSHSLQGILDGEHTERKALILWLDDSGGDYQVGFSQSGMTLHECILLCEFGKDRLKKEIYDAEE